MAQNGADGGDSRLTGRVPLVQADTAQQVITEGGGASSTETINLLRLCSHQCEVRWMSGTAQLRPGWPRMGEAQEGGVNAGVRGYRPGDRLGVRCSVRSLGQDGAAEPGDDEQGSKQQCGSIHDFVTLVWPAREPLESPVCRQCGRHPILPVQDQPATAPFYRRFRRRTGRSLRFLSEVCPWT